MGNKVQLMGILNTTPDSFYASSRCLDSELAVERAQKMAAAGADILDIGGESTRPGAEPVSVEEELQRVIPAIEKIKQTISLPISIDTKKAEVARLAIEAGASLINDITGFDSPAMVELAASTQADLCVMHMQGTPQTMQKAPHYPEGVTHHLLQWFEKKLHMLTKAGIAEERIILDPGIGFGKTVEHNVEILFNLRQFKKFGRPLLVGFSRKSFLTKIMNKPATELLSTTLAVNTMAIMAGADIIRVHDVPEHSDVIRLLTELATIAGGRTQP